MNHLMDSARHRADGTQRHAYGTAPEHTNSKACLTPAAVNGIVLHTTQGPATHLVDARDLAVHEAPQQVGTLIHGHAHHAGAVGAKVLLEHLQRGWTSEFGG